MSTSLPTLTTPAIYSSAPLPEKSRTFQIDRVKDFRLASSVKKGLPGDCLTVEIKGKTRYLFFEKTGDLFPTLG